MDENFKKIGFEFFSKNFDEESLNYCRTRDIFQARLDSMINVLLKDKNQKVDHIYILSAIIGEIGNNSFDHNIGSWVKESGIFFSYNFNEDKFEILLTDSGQGIYNTLKKVKPEIKDDREAMKVAFYEKISGRAPESRGNGLKFVKENIKNTGSYLEFFSGQAVIKINENDIIEKTNDFYQGCAALIKKKYEN